MSTPDTDTHTHVHTRTHARGQCMLKVSSWETCQSWVRSPGHCARGFPTRFRSGFYLSMYSFIYSANIY